MRFYQRYDNFDIIFNNELSKIIFLLKTVRRRLIKYFGDDKDN